MRLLSLQALLVLFCLLLNDRESFPNLEPLTFRNLLQAMIMTDEGTINIAAFLFIIEHGCCVLARCIHQPNEFVQLVILQTWLLTHEFVVVLCKPLILLEVFPLIFVHLHRKHCLIFLLRGIDLNNSLWIYICRSVAIHRFLVCTQIHCRRLGILNVIFIPTLGYWWYLQSLIIPLFLNTRVWVRVLGQLAHWLRFWC